MKEQRMNGSNVVIVGATGMIGSIASRLALADPQVDSVTTLGRRPVDLKDPKLRQIAHSDFSDCRPVQEQLAGMDAALFCLGAYTGAVPDPEFKAITVDYVVGFSEALHAASPSASFCLLSGQGADQSEKSRVAFARYKGMAENALLSMNFPRTHIFRPGYIYPVTPRDEPNFSYRVMRALWPLLRPVFPNAGISSEDLAKVMVKAGLDGTPGHESPILENLDIRSLAAEVS
jgi:uncharacterized protein YbjT (DUF2867 family)